MENFKLHFRKTLEEDKSDIKNNIEKDLSSKEEKIHGEYKKTKEELEAINLINKYLQKEIKELDIEPKSSIDISRIHFVNKEIAQKSDIHGFGVFYSDRDSISINKDVFFGERLLLYRIILHEMIHYYSFNSIIFTGSTNDIDDYRCGYSVYSKNETFRHGHFYGFNEAVTEKIVKDILRNNIQELKNKFNISEKEFKEENKLRSLYKNEINILDLIIDNMAKFYKKDPKEIWNNFKKGFFNGDMMHLRDIEETFGPGSLRVLAAMTSKGGMKNIQKENIFSNLVKFFKEKNQEKRNKLANEILSERERLHYKRTTMVE